MFQYIVLDLRVGCPILKFGHIHIFQRELNPNLFRVDLALGKQDNRLDVLRVREHVHGLHGGDFVFCAQEVQVAGLGGGIAADVHDPVGFRIEDDTGDVRMDAGPRRVQDDDVRVSVLRNEGRGEDVFHVAGEEGAVRDSVHAGIAFCILDRVFHVFDADDFRRLLGNELRDGARSGVQVVDRLRPCLSMLSG